MRRIATQAIGSRARCGAKGRYGPTYNVAAWFFARAIALIYLIAFISFGRQVRGLIGAQGIQPITEFLTEVTRQFGGQAFWRAPTIFWWMHSEYALESIAWGGAVVVSVAAIGRPHTPGQKGAFVLLFVYYLSVVNAGQIFMGYQWDYLLLEAGFLAIFLKPSSFVRVWLFRWLLFRLMLESGASKLLSHDPTWRNLTALAVHYETQPLPTPVALVPDAGAIVVSENLRGLRLRHGAWDAAADVRTPAFETDRGRGNRPSSGADYPDGELHFLQLSDHRVLPFPARRPAFVRIENQREIARPLRANRTVSLALCAIVLFISIDQFVGMFELPTPLLADVITGQVSAFGIVNQYGLFASMTTHRPEISIEGSNDGTDWQSYTFRYKPGPLNRAPGWVAPDQPRLDWQMWFAALRGYRANPWLLRFMMRLLQGSVPVIELLDHDPFAGTPPKYIRAMEYEYHFTTFDERRQTGNWWKRELKGTYFPPISLRGQQP